MCAHWKVSSIRASDLYLKVERPKRERFITWLVVRKSLNTCHSRCSMCFPELIVIVCNSIMSSSLSESLYSVVCPVCLFFCLDVLINKL